MLSIHAVSQANGTLWDRREGLAVKVTEQGSGHSTLLDTPKQMQPPPPPSLGQVGSLCLDMAVLAGDLRRNDKQQTATSIFACKS